MKKNNKCFDHTTAFGVLAIWALVSFGSNLIGFMLNISGIFSKIPYLIIGVFTFLMIVYIISYVLYHIFKKD